MALTTFLNNRAPIRLRGAMWMSFTDTGIIQTRTWITDSGGGGTATWAAVGTVACRVYPVSLRGKGALVGGQVNERSTHFCNMQLGATIHAADRIVIANRGTYEVTLTLETTSAFDTRIEVFQVS